MLNDVHKIIQMIELIKHRPQIYDITTYQYQFKSRPSVELLWQEIAAEIGTTPAECKKKWASLRNAYSRDLRIEKQAALQQRKKKKWYLADHLGFLKNYTNVYPKTMKSDGQNNETIDENPKDYTLEENTNYYDLSTQNGTKEEIDELGTTNYFASVNSNSLVGETPQMQIQYAAPDPGPTFLSPSTSSATSAHDTKIHYRNPSQHIAMPPQGSSSEIRPHVNGQQQKPASEHTPQTFCSHAIKQCQIGESTPCKKGIISKDEGQSSVLLDDRNMTFFRSIIPDILRLSDRKQRLYKQNVIMKLNKFLDE